MSLVAYSAKAQVEQRQRQTARAHTTRRAASTLAAANSKHVLQPFQLQPKAHSVNQQAQPHGHTMNIACHKKPWPCWWQLGQWSIEVPVDAQSISPFIQALPHPLSSLFYVFISFFHPQHPKQNPSLSPHLRRAQWPKSWRWPPAPKRPTTAEPAGVAADPRSPRRSRRKSLGGQGDGWKMTWKQWGQPFFEENRK